MFSKVGVPNIFQGTWMQLLAAIVGTLSAISDGMQYGWTAPVTPILLGENSPIKTTKHQAEWLESILMIGAFCGLPVTIYMVDKFGRKISMIASAVTVLIVWILIATVHVVEVIFFARFMAGMAGDMAFVAAPIYIAEIADQKIRGFLSSLIYIMMLTGILLCYAIVPFVPFYVPSIIGGGILLLEIIIFPFMPDSPYYLLYKDRPEEAKAALQCLRQRDDVDAELKDITIAIERQKSEKGRPQDLFLIPSNRKAMIIMCVLNAAQHMSSISVMLMNMHSILFEAGSNYIEPSTAAIIFSALMFAAAMSASLLMDRFGRRFLIISSSTLSGLCLLAIAVYFTFMNAGYDVLEVSWIPVAAVMLYATVFKAGLGLVPIVLTAELFPAKVKAMGMTISDCMYVGFCVISLQVYHLFKDSYGIHIPFYVFAICCFLTVIFAIVMIPETKGKTLEEIQLMLKGNKTEPSPEAPPVPVIPVISENTHM